MSRISRRGFIQALGIGAGATFGSRLIGPWIPNAAAAESNSAVVLVYLNGGFNSIFVSSDSFAANKTFGVKAGGYTNIGNNVSLDNIWSTGLSTFAKQHLAVLGIRHGFSAHQSAAKAVWSGAPNMNGGLMLADALGGSGSIKAALVGNAFTGGLLVDVPTTPLNGIAYEQINDMQSTIDALAGAKPGPTVPDRTIALSSMSASETMSTEQLAASPKSLVTLDSGYRDAVATLKQPVKAFNVQDLLTAYKLGTSTAIVRPRDATTGNSDTFKAQMAAAELMVRAGTNVVTVIDGGRWNHGPGWDTHNDPTGKYARDAMANTIPTLSTFIARMIEQNPTQNVVLAVFAEMSRSLPNSDHQPNLSAAVFGRHVVAGSTGKAGADASLNPNTPGPAAFWSYLAEASKAPKNPFGPNPHGLVS